MILGDKMLYKFKGGDRVKVDTRVGGLDKLLNVNEFTGTIVYMVSDLPLIGQSYVVLADKPEEAGLNTEFYPFSAIPLYEAQLTKI